MTQVASVGTLTLVLGLAGSGKSHLVAQLVVHRAFEEGFKDTPAHHTELIDRLKQGEHCSVSEIAYLEPTERQAFVDRVRARVPGVHVNFICFENNLPAANANCANRPDKDEKDGSPFWAINAHETARYTLPEGAILMKVYRAPVKDFGLKPVGFVDPLATLRSPAR